VYNVIIYRGEFLMSKTYEMLWDCQFCGTSKNLGLTHRFCPSCGSPQNPDSRYYPSEADMVEVKDHQFVGIDVTCPACNQLNGAASEFCGQCGSPLTEGAKAKTLDLQSAALGVAFGSSGARDLVKEKHDSEMRRVGVLKDEKSKGGMNWGLFAIIGLVIAGLIGAIVAFTWKTETTLIVTDHQWQRVINIEEYNRFTESNWRDSRPAGDDVTMGACREQQRSTRRVADGETCHTVRRDQGDGTFRSEQECTTNYREEAVYDDMCTWTGYRWEFSEARTEEGDLDDSPRWPSITNLNDCQSARVGCEREASREEHYWLFFRGTEDETNYQCDMTEEVWEATSVESLWTGQVGLLVRSTIDCESLKPKD
jgi:hypothetical protein